MRRIVPRHAWALGALVAMASLASAAPPKNRGGEPPLKGEETVGNLAQIIRGGDVPVEGVGLVVGLDGTGSDPEPSHYRQKLLDEMRKAGVPDADKILADPSTSLVIVRGRVPTGISSNDPLDVELELTPASTTTSLAGGWLMRTRLVEKAVVDGQALDGEYLAEAIGPVMTGTTADPDEPKVGRVLGGCRVRRSIPYALVIHERHRSGRTAAMIQAAINRRFHQSAETDLKGMAHAKTDQYLELRVPRMYHHNQARYCQVVKLLPMVDVPTLRAQRLEQWGEALRDPQTAGMASLRLEGIGPNAIDTLKTGLESPHPQVRFFAAESLAYLNDSSGVDVLVQTAVEWPAFRAFALAALAAMDEPAATLRLRALMDAEDIELRYGAFEALRTQDPTDPFLGEVPLMRDDLERYGDDPTALAIAARRRRQARRQEPFRLYEVDCEGPPMIHVTGRKRPEIVLFGAGQTLLAPAVLGGGGAILLNASDGDSVVQISRIEVGRFDDVDLKVTAPLELREVIRETANLGATYPEIVAILQTAFTQKNLPGPLFVDAAPALDPSYDEALVFGVDATVKKDEAVTPAGLEAEAVTKTPSRLRRLRDRLRIFRRGSNR